MRTLIEVLAVLAIAANAIVYGTDVFGAIVLRPAIAAVDDRTFTQLLGHVHRIADRRFAVIGAGGLVAAMAMTALAAVSKHSVSAAAGAIATVAPRGLRAAVRRLVVRQLRRRPPLPVMKPSWHRAGSG